MGKKECPKCHGDSRLKGINCKTCLGKGFVSPKQEVYTIDLSFEMTNVRDVLFEEMWEELLRICILNNHDEGIEWLITNAIAYFGEHHKSEVLWKKLKITD